MNGKQISLPSLPKCPKCGGLAFSNKCLICNGRGHIINSRLSPKSRSVECRVCGGTGKVYKCAKCKSTFYFFLPE